MSNILFDERPADSELRERLYAGDIFVFSPTPAGIALCELAREMTEEAFHPHAPPEAQHHLPVQSFIEILAQLKPKFIHHPRCKEIIPQLLAELGCDMSHTYFDVPRLRTACAGNYLSTGLAYAFLPHRDTWYSTPMCQVNWWMPVFPICAENSMAFHPHYWDRPVQNSSAGFNYQNWNSDGRPNASRQPVQRDSRFQSAALEELELQPDLRLICPPGGVIAFSAAHLHSTVPNHSGLTRISIDFRTVDIRDVADWRGAPNMDSRSTGTTLMDYLRCSDLEHVSPELIQSHAELNGTCEAPDAPRTVARA